MTSHKNAWLFKKIPFLVPKKSTGGPKPPVDFSTGGHLRSPLVCACDRARAHISASEGVCICMRMSEACAYKEALTTFLCAVPCAHGLLEQGFLRVSRLVFGLQHVRDLHAQLEHRGPRSLQLRLELRGLALWNGELGFELNRFFHELADVILHLRGDLDGRTCRRAGGRAVGQSGMPAGRRGCLWAGGHANEQTGGHASEQG